jgi:hypothetical protein
MNKADLQKLHQQLEQLQAEIEAGRWFWRDSEKDALVTVMDAILGTAGDRHR